MTSGKLTQKDVKTLPPGKHPFGDGLLLKVTDSGARSWILRVTIKGQGPTTGTRKRVEIGLGGSSYTVLKEAKEKAYELRKLAKQGMDPRTAEGRDRPTFDALAIKVHQKIAPSASNPKHAAPWINTLREYAFRHIGHLRVDKIGQPELLKVARQIVKGKDGEPLDF